MQGGQRSKSSTYKYRRSCSWSNYPQFLSIHLLSRIPQTILIAYIDCLSVGLILCAKLVHRDAKSHRVTGSIGAIREATRGERALAVEADLFQAALLVTSTTAPALAITSTGQLRWLDLSITCALQFIVGTNVRTRIKTRQPANS